VWKRLQGFPESRFRAILETCRDLPRKASGRMRSTRMNRDMCGRRAAILLVAAHLTTIGAAVASAQISDENPPVMLQWFETR